MFTGQASALSVRQYEGLPQEKRIEFLVSAIDKLVSDTAAGNPAVSRAIHDYFHVSTTGKPES